MKRLLLLFVVGAVAFVLGMGTAMGLFAGDFRQVAVFGGPLLLLFIGLSWYKRRYGGLKASLIAAAHAVPAAITLVPVARVEWPDPEGNRKLYQELQRLGFMPVSPFSIPQMPGVELIGFYHPTDPAYAALYWHPKAGRWLDIYGHYADGGTLTVTNAPNAGVLDPMPGREKVPVQSPEPAELWARYQASRRRAPVNPMTAANFKPDFERVFAEEMAWRKGRGGATEDEIRRVAMRKGMMVTERQVQDVREVERIKAGKPRE